MNLYELVKSKSGLDVCDKVFDVGMYFDFSDDGDNYDRCMVDMAKRIEVIEVKENWYTICNITKFLETNKKIFDDFIEKFYKDEYKPKKSYTPDEEEFYDVYVELFEQLVIGSWCDKHYAWLLKELEERGK